MITTVAATLSRGYLACKRLKKIRWSFAMATASTTNAALTENREAPPIPIRRRPLHDEATERIRDMIVEGRLAAGEWINETELCQQLQISRTPLREALKVLATEGLVELVARRGAYVAQLSMRELVDLFEALSGIEGLAAELAAVRMSAVDLETLRQLQVRIEHRHKARDRHAYFHDNQELHKSIVRFSGNSAIVDIHARLIARVRRARYQAILSEERWSESVQEHALILAALESRDGRRASDLMRKHVAHTGDVVRASMDDIVR
jgi:DNA-binding GntR family transcriptional regulator